MYIFLSINKSESKIEKPETKSRRKVFKLFKNSLLTTHE